MLILGIETSCDETAASILCDGKQILSNVVASQIDIHKKYGGIVPELASRKHIESINFVIQEALELAEIDLAELDAVAVTSKPGLVGSLLIGISAAKALSYVLDIPLIAVNHVEAHIAAIFLESNEIEFPFISLVVSGGHTNLFFVDDYGEYELLGRTLDDAAGEAFDKIAKMLNLTYPGGPIIDQLSKEGNPEAIIFPRAYLSKDSLDFSFSGLKTAVLNYINNYGTGNKFGDQLNSEIGKSNYQSDKDISLNDIAASFQQAIVDVLVDKTIKAALTKKVEKIVLAGGVACNSCLRLEMRKRAQQRGIKVFYPNPILCTDNAAMIAHVGYHQFLKNDYSALNLNASASFY